MDQMWSWILTIVGVTGFILAGRKVWWCWYINIGCQALWITYAIVTEQWGFIVASLIYTVVFTKNAIAWTKEHKYSEAKELNDYAKKDVALTEEMYKKGLKVPPSYLGPNPIDAESAILSARRQHYNNIDERGRPKCGVWSELGPCIRDQPHRHEFKDG